MSLINHVDPNRFVRRALPLVIQLPRRSYIRTAAYIITHRCVIVNTEHLVLFDIIRGAPYHESMAKRQAGGKDPLAVALGRRGGKATASKRTPKERSEAARKAVLARWARAKPKKWV